MRSKSSHHLYTQITVKPQHSRGMLYTPETDDMKRPLFNVSSLPLRAKRYHIYVGLMLALIVVITAFHSMAYIWEKYVEFRRRSHTDGELVKLPESFAAEHGAYCLDGSTPGYYFRPGHGDGSRSWMILLPPGGWCATEEECWIRSYTPLGSTTNAPTIIPLTGIQSANADVNPAFHDWNMVQPLYCDGGTFSGKRIEELFVKGKPLYLRGALVFKAVVQHLINEHHLDRAGRVILCGQSAGGLAIMLNKHTVVEKLPRLEPSNIHLILDGAIFPDLISKDGDWAMRQIFQSIFTLHHMEGSPECVQHKDAEKWKCLILKHLLKVLRYRLLFINSLQDSFLVKRILGVTCPLHECSNSDMKLLKNLTSLMVNEMEPIDGITTNGFYLFQDRLHVILQDEDVIRKLQVQGHSVMTAITDWYFKGEPLFLKRTTDGYI